MDAFALWTISAATLAAILAGIETGYRLGRETRSRSEAEKEAPVSAIAGTILAMLAFIMAFTFGIVSDRYDVRKALVLEEANAIRTAWLRAAFLPEPDRGEAVALLRQYVDGRLSSIQSGDFAAVQRAVVQAGDIQRRLWDMAVLNARKDMNSDVAALYVDALNTMANVHAARVSVGLHARMPAGIWLALYVLMMLSMVAVGYHTAIAGSRRSWMMLIMGLSFTLVITLIVALDRPWSGYVPVSQQPLDDLRSTMAAQPSTHR
jgi:MFS family permease